MNPIEFTPVVVEGTTYYYVSYEGARPPHGPYRANTIANVLAAALRDIQSRPDPKGAVIGPPSVGATDGGG